MPNERPWTTSADITLTVERHWSRGFILREVALPTNHFPLRVPLTKPTPAELSARFGEVRSWITELRSHSGYRVEMTEVNTRQLGTNQVPKCVWIESADHAAELIGRSAELQTFRRLVDVTEARRPELLPWLAKHALQALDLESAWSRILDVVDWLQANPRPNLYLRQIDIPGVHTKFIEEHQNVFSQLFDVALPDELIEFDATDRNSFCRRYGFRDKPSLVRFRVLDPTLNLVPQFELTDEHHTFSSENFARVRNVETVFITENEINFLAFPNVKQSIVIFGAGFGFSFLAPAKWLHEVPIHYWGDIDTYGFVILDQLRGEFAHAQSLLMDVDTLLAHEPQWGFEPVPARQDLHRLTKVERDLYNDLRDNRIRANLRLEQERVGYSTVARAVEKLVMSRQTTATT
jgi:hypothetical protein